MVQDSENNFIKVELDDSRRRQVNVKEIEPITGGIKVIRKKEPSLSSEGSYSESESSEISDESYEKTPTRPKKTKKVLRKVAHRVREDRHDYSEFSNPKKISKNQQFNDSESEYSDISESEYGSESSDGGGNQSPEMDEKQMWEDKQKLKQDLLIKIQALEKKGFEFSKKFNMTSSYEEMEFEYSKVKKFIDTQAGIKMARRALMACVTGLEFLNRRFDPFNLKLDGWSENIMESVDDYDNIFERLLEKYSSKAEMAPEIELLLTLGGSAFMFHLTNSLLKGPTMDPIAQNNPNFLSGMMSALNQGMKESSKPPNFKTPGANHHHPQNAPPPPMETRGARKEMRGPSMDPSLFNGTPLATNHPNQVNVMPKPPLPTVYPDLRNYYEENPIDEDDRFSVASSSDSSLSSAYTKTIKKVTKKNKNGGLELNIS
jgi:hypothetical protein